MTALAVAQRRGLVALAGREIRRVLSLWTQTLLPPVATGALFLAVLGGALGDRLRVSEAAYVEFLLPGLLILTVAGQAFANNSTSLFQAKSEGYVEDVLTSPLRAWQLAVGFLAGGVVRGLTAAAALLLVALPFVDGIANPGVLAASLALTAVAFAALGVLTGMWAESFDQHSFVANLVVTPLVLVGGVFYPARLLEEPWEQLTRLDPIFYLVDAARHGVVGLHEAPVAEALAVTAVVTAALVAVLVRLLDRGWGLKP